MSKNNLPERIYINESADLSMNGIAYQVPTTTLLANDVEYVRADIVEKTAYRFLIFYSTTHFDNCMYKINGQFKEIKTLDELYQEFLKQNQ